MQIARARARCLPGSAMYIMYMILAILVWVFTFTGRADAITWDQTKHGNPVSGVDRSGAPYPTGDCAHCHDILDASICAGGPPYQFAAVDVLCFLPECHLYIQQIYQISTDRLIGGVAGDYYQTVNTKHDVLDSDQIYSGAKLECINCHATHRGADPSVDPSQNILCDPDDKYTAFTHTVIHPGTNPVPVFDSDMFCSRCHDGTWAPGVTGPTTSIKNTSITYHTTGAGGDSHGVGVGDSTNPMPTTSPNDGTLIGPYWGKSSPVGLMPCQDCHDNHASGGIFHLKTLSSRFGTPATITVANWETNAVSYWCSHCHYQIMSPDRLGDPKKGSCLKSNCHAHGVSSSRF